jgi:dihydroneopterin aldolase
MDKIFIENYTLIAKHGYYKEEHFKPQRFTVSVWCDIASRIEPGNDNLDDTFNYEHIRKIIKEVVLGDHKKLLETLSEDIAAKILQHSQVVNVRVKIGKPDIWGDCEPGVEIVRTQQVKTGR